MHKRFKWLEIGAFCDSIRDPSLRTSHYSVLASG